MSPAPVASTAQVQGKAFAGWRRRRGGSAPQPQGRCISPTRAAKPAGATCTDGEVAEWLKAHAWKVCLRETVTRVRIPLSPPAPSEPYKPLKFNGYYPHHQIAVPHGGAPKIAQFEIPRRLTSESHSLNRPIKSHTSAGAGVT